MPLTHAHDQTEGSRADRRPGTGSGRLRWRLLGWFLLFSLLPLAASNTLGYLRSRGIIERLIEGNVQALADIRARQVHGALERQVRELQNLAAGNEFMAAGMLLASGRRAGAMGSVADREALDRHLMRKHEGLPSFDALFLLGPGGDVVVHTGRADPAGMRLPERMPLTWSVVPGETARLRLLTPVRDEHGLAVGYLGGLISTRGLQLMFGVTAHEEGSIESFVVDARGHPLFASHTHQQIRFTEPLPTPLLEGEEISGIAHYRDRAGQRVVGTVAAIPDVGWYYLAEAPLGVVLAPLTRLRSLSLGFAAGLCLILGLAAWLVAGGIVAPVRRLVTATQRIGAGDLGVRVHERPGDELGELADAFNTMTTELERASERVRELHQREIERAGQLATVGELASSVAHEIKNPVVSIANGLDLVHRRLGQDATLSPIMDEMRRQLQRIDAAVRDLLSYARPTAPSLGPALPSELVQRASRLVQIAAERAGVELRLELEPDRGQVSVDAELLTQALVNLLLNAVQATPAGGSVTVRSAVVSDTLRLEVADTGRGIPPDDLAHIFKPFFTTRHSGTGLGLSIAREVAARHGGEVEVQSTTGIGSTFTIVLPLDPEHTPALVSA